MTRVLRRESDSLVLVHRDDDRNVPFQQTTDLVGKLPRRKSRSRS
jgi:dipeptidyl aminopeptidase/acylaminoacyl peptidase